MEFKAGDWVVLNPRMRQIMIKDEMSRNRALVESVGTGYRGNQLLNLRWEDMPDYVDEGLRAGHFMLV